MNRVYTLYHIHRWKKELSECKYGHDDSKILGIFSSQIKAEEALSMIIKVSPSKVSKDQLVIVKDNASSIGTGSPHHHNRQVTDSS